MGVVDDLGAPVTVTGVPRRVVSLVPNLSETLWTWGLAHRLVAVTEWCAYPRDGFPDAHRIRGTKNPDVARIVALAPDLVIANEEENRELDVRRLREAGLAVLVTRVRTVAGVADSVDRLGTVLGTTAGGELAGRVRGAVAHAADPARPRRRVYCAVWRDGTGGDPAQERWWGLGRDTYGADLLACCGLEVVPADADARYPRHRLGALASWDPDIVLLPDEPYAFGEADREVFASWRARTEFVDGRDLWWWGPRTPGAIERLRALAGSR